MKLVAARVAMATLLVLSTGFLLQAQDTTLPAAPAAPLQPVQLAPILTAQATDGREYFIRRHEVVPVGASILRLPILMYHYIRTPPSTRTDMLGFRLSVSPQDFQEQMDWLYANHFHPVTFDQVRAYFAGRVPLPSKPVVMTFDDGYADLYTTAFPILQAHGFAAVAYIVSGFVDRGRYVTHDQVLQMDRAGIEIASHTVDHADMARVSSGMATYQLVRSKQWLEGLLGHPVVDFAYPSGQYNLQTIQLLGQYGYNTAVIEDGTSMHSWANRYTWGRVRVGGGESLHDFIANLGESMPSVTLSSLDVKPS
ncbi:MAG TPA: polysaccharide deacetylase family protein [Candidatus Dormibacteraeota bacterium]|nr:polysaccharide deacetylase family protein [Candidatus Dormibacteraeota bacterium]